MLKDVVRKEQDNESEFYRKRDMQFEKMYRLEINLVNSIISKAIGKMALETVKVDFFSSFRCHPESIAWYLDEDFSFWSQLHIHTLSYPDITYTLQIRIYPNNIDVSFSWYFSSSKKTICAEQQIQDMIFTHSCWYFICFFEGLE